MGSIWTRSLGRVHSKSQAAETYSRLASKLRAGSTWTASSCCIEWRMIDNVSHMDAQHENPPLEKSRRQNYIVLCADLDYTIGPMYVCIRSE